MALNKITTPALTAQVIMVGGTSGSSFALFRFFNFSRLSFEAEAFRFPFSWTERELEALEERARTVGRWACCAPLSSADSGTM